MEIRPSEGQGTYDGIDNPPQADPKTLVFTRSYIQENVNTKEIEVFHQRNDTKHATQPGLFWGLVREGERMAVAVVRRENAPPLPPLDTKRSNPTNPTLYNRKAGKVRGANLTKTQIEAKVTNRCCRQLVRARLPAFLLAAATLVSRQL